MSSDGRGNHEVNQRDTDKDDMENQSDELLPLLGRSSVQVVQQRKPFILPEVISFLFFVSFVTQFPVVQFWLFDHFSREYDFVQSPNDSDLCMNTSKGNSSYHDIEKQVQSQTNNYVMYTNFVGSFVAIVPTLLLGPLTDKYGRKFILYICFIGLLISQLMNIFIFLYDLTPALLLISSGLQGVSGTYGLFMVSMFCIVADITSPGKQRSVRVAAMEAAIAISTSIGYITAGIFVKEIGCIWPMIISMGELVLASLFALFLMPETLREHNYHPFSFKTLVSSFTFYVKDTPNKRRFKLIICLICFLTVFGAAMGESNISLLYLLHEPFCWPKDQITVYGGIVVFAKWVSVLIFIFLGKRCLSEPGITLVGVISGASGFLLKGLAKDDLLIYLSAGASLLMETVSPMCRTMMSKAVSLNEQGALFAGMAVVQMTASAVSGVVVSSIYSVGLNFFLGLPYMVLSGVVILNVFWLIALIIHGRRYPLNIQPIREQLITQ